MHVTLRIVNRQLLRLLWFERSAIGGTATYISAQAISNFFRATVQAVESMIGSTILIVTPVGEPRRFPDARLREGSRGI